MYGELLKKYKFHLKMIENNYTLGKSYLEGPEDNENYEASKYPL